MAFFGEYVPFIEGKHQEKMTNCHEEISEAY